MSHKELEKKIWTDISERLKVDLGKSAFENWIKPLNLTEIDKKTAFFVSPTGFIGDWVNRNYGEKIIEVMWECGFEVDRLKFSSGLSPRKISKEENKQDNNQNKIADKGVLIQSDTEVPGSPLDKRFTFDSFVVGKPNELAHAAARRVAESDLSVI